MPHSLCVTAGWKAIARNAAIGAVLLALIEGASIMLMKWAASSQMGACARSLPSLLCFLSSHVFTRIGVNAAAQQQAGRRVDDLAPPIPPPIGNFSTLSLGGAASEDLM